MLTVKQLIAAMRLEQACGRGPKHPLECSRDHAARQTADATDRDLERQWERAEAQADAAPEGSEGAER